MQKFVHLAHHTTVAASMFDTSLPPSVLGVEFVHCSGMSLPVSSGSFVWAVKCNSLESFDEGLDGLSLLLWCGQKSWHGDFQVVLKELDQEEDFYFALNIN